MNSIQVDVNDCIQPNLVKPTPIHPDRHKFEQMYAKKGFYAVMRRWGDYGWKYKARVFFHILKHTIKSIFVRR